MTYDSLQQTSVTAQSLKHQLHMVQSIEHWAPIKLLTVQCLT